MANISNIIEKFILDNMVDDNLELSRNDLADFFSCAPSQINYVLSTRFTYDRGFSIQSQRGGGGYVRIVRLKFGGNEYIKDLIQNSIGNELDYNRFIKILEVLVNNEILTTEQASTLDIACLPGSLASPFKVENLLRANILKNTLINLLKGEKL